MEAFIGNYSIEELAKGDDAVVEAVNNYKAAKARMEGIQEKFQQTREQQYEESDRSIQANDNNGMVYATQLKDEPVFITGGNVALNEDGTIDVDNSSETLYVKFPDGHVEMTSPDKFTEVFTSDRTADLKAAKRTEIDAKWKAEFDAAEVQSVEQEKRDSGVVFDMTDAQGEHRIEILNEGEEMSDILLDGAQMEIPTEELNRWKQEAGVQAENVTQTTETTEVVGDQVTEGGVPGQSGVYADNQGNPVDADGKLVLDEVNSIDEISDEDFETPTRNVQLPAIPENVANAIGTNGRPVVIKKNVFEKNGNTHVELEPEDSRNILRSALYNPNLVGSTQPIRRPDYKVAIRTGEQNAVVVLDVYQEKDFVEIVGWRMVNEKGLAKMQRQAEREGGQFLILSPNDGSAAALSALPLGLSSESEGTAQDVNLQENAQKSGENNQPDVPDFFRLNGTNYEVASRNDDGSVDVMVNGKRETLPAGTDYSTYMPTDKKGEVQYEQMPVERTHEYFVQRVKDDEARAEMIEKRRKKAEAERKRFDKKPDPGIDPDAYEAKMTQWEAEKKAAQAKVDYWNEIAKRDAEITRSETREAVENIKPDVMKETADEFIANQLAGIKITPESFKRETGLSNAEQAQLVGVISNDGVSVERAAEIILENYDSELKALGFTGDVQDVRDIIIDVLSLGNPRSYAKKGREAREAENMDQQRADAEVWAKGAFDMTLDELYLYEETILPRMIRDYEGFDENEYYSNLAENNGYDTTRESESIGRGGKVLQGEQSVPAAGTPTVGQRNEGGAVSDDVQGGGQNGVAQGETGQVNNETLSQGTDQVGDQVTVPEGNAPGLNGVVENNNANALQNGNNELNLQKENESDNESNQNDIPIGGQVSQPVPQGEHGTQTSQVSGAQEVAARLRERIESAQGDSKSGLREVENRVTREFAQENGLWIENETELGTPFPSGDEHNNYIDTENQVVYKVNNRMHTPSILDLLDRIEQHNKYFPDSKYSLVGFTSVSKNGDVLPVFAQDFVSDARMATNEEIDSYMGTLGFIRVGDGRYSNGEVIIKDLHPRNVLADADGDIYVVDAEFEQENVQESGEIAENGGENAKSPMQELADQILDRAEEKRRIPLRERARELEAQVGVKANIIESVDEVADPEARRRIVAGQNVAGWYSKGEVYLYMPNLQDRREIELTYVHEVVAHHGVKKLLGKRFNEFLDGVWNMMSEADRARKLAYVGAVDKDGIPLENPSVEQMRAAADEYVADLAERMDLNELEQSTWEKIVDWFKELLENIGFENLTKEDIESMLKASYANLRSTEQRAESTGTQFRIAEVNERFNNELQQQIDGTLPKGHIYELGMPSEVLRSAGLPNLPIELAASRLSDKSMQENHPFELSEIKGLVEAVQEPLAVFRSATRLGSFVVLTEIQHEGRNYVVAIETNRDKGRIQINSVRSIHYRNSNKHIANWIEEGLLEYADKKRMSEWLSKQQYNSADVRNLFRHSAKLVESFENPTIESENTLFRTTFHGSGAKFDRFDHAFMGTGEGAQAFGWGTYVTEVEGIGKQYARTSLKKQELESDLSRALERLPFTSGEARIETEEFIADVRKELEEIGTGRNLYTVEIPDDNGSNYLHWEEKINGEIQERIANGLQSIGFELEPEMNHLAYSRDGKIAVLNINAKGKDLYAELSEALGGDKAASLFLNDMGFVGISYPAEATTGGRADGARNYVIFNEDDAVIEDRTQFRIKDDAQNRKDSERRKEKVRLNNAIDTAVGFILGSKELAKKRRLKKEAERKQLAKEIYSSVLKGDFNDVTLSQIDKFIEDATPANPFGRRISQRLPQRMERALRQGARTNAVDALFSRISESAVPANERFSEAGRREIEERKKELLKGWAIATGNWHTDLKEFTDDTEPIGEGKDSKVYSSKDGRYVIKASKGKPYGKRFRPDIDNIALFNDVFRDTRYEILGYGEIDGEFVRILQQPIVDFAQSTPLTSEERREYMQSLGFEPLNDANTAFADGEIVIADLQKGNVVRDAAGNISVIDADAKLHTKDVGGDYTYPPVEEDLPEDSGTRFRKVGNTENNSIFANTYKTEDGKDINYTSERTEGYGVQDAGTENLNSGAGRSILQRQTDTGVPGADSGLDAEKGEFCVVERVFTENGAFNFTSGEKIESADDVAYIFSALEDAAKEHSFVVYVKDGMPTVVELGMGSFNATMVDVPTASLAYSRINPDHVYFVHNHPSGNLICSSQDVAMLRVFEDMSDVPVTGVIINLKTGKYGTFDTERHSVIGEKRVPEKEERLAVHTLDKQIFAPDYDPMAQPLVRGSQDVAQFLNSQRMGDRPKVSFLILSRANRIIGNIHTPFTNITTDVEAVARYINERVIQFGGENAILYGDFAITSVEGMDFRLLQNAMDRFGKTKLLDVVRVEGNFTRSANDMGLLYEPEAEYKDGQTMFRMGSRVDARMAEVAAHFDGKQLTAEQRAVVDVFGGKADNLTVSAKTQDGNERKVVMRQGNEMGAGAKHSLYRHYGMNNGAITAEDILFIPEILANGETAKNGKKTVYRYSTDGVEYTVITENNKGREEFANFYTNRKASSAARKTRSEEARDTADDASEDKGSDNSSNTQEGETRFSTRGEGIDNVPTQPLTLMERITNSLLEVSAKNKENLELRASALRTFGRDINRVLSLMKAQREYDKSTVDTLVKLAKMYFQNAQLLGEVTPYEVARIMGVLNRSVGKRDISTEAAKLMDILLDAHTNALAGILDKAEKIKAKKVNAAGVEVMGRLDKYGQKRVDEYRAAKGMTPEKLEEAIFDSDNRLAELEQRVREVLGLPEGDVDQAAKEYTGDNDVVNVYMDERARLEGLTLAREYKESIQQVQEEIKDLKRELKQAEEDYRLGNIDGKSLKEFRKSVAEAIMESKAELIEGYHSLIYKFQENTKESSQRAKEFAQAQIDRAREIQHNANSDMEGIPADTQGTHPDNHNNAVMNALRSPFPTFQGMLKKFGEKNVEGKGYLYERFMPQATKASDSEFRGKVAARVMIEAKLKEIYGEKANIARFMKELREYGATVTYREGNEMKQFDLTKGQMLYIYMVNNSAFRLPKLRVAGSSPVYRSLYNIQRQPTGCR